MHRLMTAIVIATFLTTVAHAEDKPADVSLSREVDQYLEKSAESTWQEPNTMRAFFKDGLRLESNDGNFTMKIGGRLMWDNVWRSSDEFGDNVTLDSTYFRRVRLFVSGTIYKKFDFKVQVDFSKSTLALKDVYGKLKEISVIGSIKIGHFKEAFGLQELTSSKYIQVIERSTPIQAFAPAHNSGVAVENAWMDKRLTLQLWYGRTTDDQGQAMADGNSAITIRITGLAVWDEDKKTLLHFGLALSYRSINSFRARARPGVGDKDRLVDTGSFDAESSLLIGFEVAFRWKSVSVQAEYIMADVESVSEGDPNFGGYYVELSWFLTGESRAYKKGSGTWGRTRPKRNFHGEERGSGAIQLVVRFDTLDLNDNAINGGEMDTLIFGANWHSTC